MPKFRVPVWRTIEVIETGYLDIEAESPEAARREAERRLEIGTANCEWTELGDACAVMQAPELDNGDSIVELTNG